MAELTTEPMRCPLCGGPRLDATPAGYAQRVAVFARLAEQGHEQSGTREWRGTVNGDRVVPW